MTHYEYYDNYLVPYSKIVSKVRKKDHKKMVRLNDKLLEWYDNSGVWELEEAD
jgi:hypothetical protein